MNFVYLNVSNDNSKRANNVLYYGCAIGPKKKKTPV